MQVRDRAAIKSHGVGHGGLPYAYAPDHDCNGYGFGGYGTGPEPRHSGAIAFAKVFVLACIFIIAALLVSPVHAQCVYPNNDTSQWGWDNTARVTCPPGGSNSAPVSSGGAIVAIRFHWQANPVAESVDRYQLDYQLNNSNWNTFPIVWNDTEYVAYLNQYGINAGNEVCARVRAGTHNQWSEFSESVCVDIPVESSGSSIFGVSVPSNLQIQTRDY